MKKTIKVGDSVRHCNPYVSGGLPISVLEISTDGNTLKCSYLAGFEQIDKTDWFLVNEVTILHYGNNT
jgi:hypothetical protein